MALSLKTHRHRMGWVSAFFMLAFLVILGRLFYLCIGNHEFLQAQGDMRTVHAVTIPAYRGMILDRRGEPLAISTPLASVWINPKHFNPSSDIVNQLAAALNLSADDILKKSQQTSRHFIYLKRFVHPKTAQLIQTLNHSGLFLEKGFKRYYPAREDVSQLLGFTNIDDRGQAGLELWLNDTLSPSPGKKRVLRDRRGHRIRDLDFIQSAQSGSHVYLSIDARIQALARRHLEEALTKYDAKSATVVMIDIKTSEVLALLSSPTFNPNNHHERTGDNIRLKAVTDPIEPGSTIKPFTVAAAIESGQVTPETRLNTAPGYLKIGKETIRDVKNFGELTVSQILSKSSNVGISKLALKLPTDTLLNTFRAFNLGDEDVLGLPGESSGRLSAPQNNHTLAVMGFGYGLSTTPLQLAQAYAILGAFGEKRPITLMKRGLTDYPPTERVLSKQTAQVILTMLETVTNATGTGKRASILGYRTAGKTGTVRLIGADKRYVSNRHLALFAGITPAHRPRLATVILVEEPKTQYYGGLVAAPLYAKIVGGALQILNIPPAMPAS